CSQVRMDAKRIRWIGWIGKALGGRNRLAGILHERCMLWMQKRALAFAEKGEPQFVDGSRSDGPSVADVYLLNALIRKIPEIGQRRSAGLKLCKRLRQIMLGEIVVARQVLILGQLMVDLD